MMSINVEQYRTMKKKEQVTDLLKNNRDGLTVVEIARMLKISRNTASVALAELFGAGKIRIRPIGVAKLHYWQGGKI